MLFITDVWQFSLIVYRMKLLIVGSIIALLICNVSKETDDFDVK